MPVATCASMLLRSRIRNLSSLPRAELDALKGAVSELGAIGRNLNQTARAANAGRVGASSARADLEALLRVCEALRLQMLLKAVSERGVRLHIDKRTLRRWRQAFARHLRAEGIETAR